MKCMILMSCFWTKSRSRDRNKKKWTNFQNDQGICNDEYLNCIYASIHIFDYRITDVLYYFFLYLEQFEMSPCWIFHFKEVNVWNICFIWSFLKDGFMWTLHDGNSLDLTFSSACLIWWDITVYSVQFVYIYEGISQTILLSP